MSGVRRAIWLTIAALFVAVGVLWPLPFSGLSQAGPASDPVTISDFRADFRIDAAGDLDAVETITGEFPGDRHGIFRYWDVANPNDSGVRQEPNVISVLMDGAPMPYTMLWEDGDRFRVAKIGDPGSYLDYGTHVFEIRYTIPGVIDPGTTGERKEFAGATGDPGRGTPSVFYWNVIAPSWNNQIDHADITVTLPAPITGAQCSVGSGVGRACTDLTIGGDAGRTLTVSATDLAPRTPVTVRAGVDMATPARVELPWSYKWDRILGRSVRGVIWVAALTLAGAAAGLLMYRSTVEKPPPFPLQYEPPAGIGPVQSEYIRTEAVGPQALTATLFHLADRHLIEMRQTGKKKWTLRYLPSPDWASVDPVAGAVAATLGIERPGGEFNASGSVTAGERLNKAKGDIGAAVRTWAQSGGFTAPHRVEHWVRVANLAALVLAVTAAIRWLFPATMWVLPFAAFFLCLALSWRSGVGTRRTATGRELWSRAGGFHRMLVTDSAEARFDFAARKDLYAAYLPFALAAGAAALWAKKYQAMMGAPAPQPDWYHSSDRSSSWFGGDSSGSVSFDSFESALSSSIGAYTASQSSSSSGGGGGGGGGSW